MLLSGNAMSSSATRVAELAGLAVAGALIATIGIAWTILIDAGLFALSALIMSRVGYPETSTSANNDSRTSIEIDSLPSEKSSIFSEMAEAFHFLRKHSLLLIVSILFAFINFCLMPFNVLRTPYVIETPDAGAGGLSLLSGLMVGGMLLSGVWLTQRGAKYRKKCAGHQRYCHVGSQLCDDGTTRLYDFLPTAGCGGLLSTDGYGDSAGYNSAWYLSYGSYPFGDAGQSVCPSDYACLECCTTWESGFGSTCRMADHAGSVYRFWCYVGHVSRYAVI